MKKLVILISFLLLSYLSYAQTFRGVIVDSLTNKAIAGVHIQLLKNHSFTTSDLNGRFMITVRSSPDSVMLGMHRFPVDQVT